MVIDSMFVYQFVDLDLRIEIFFEKESPAENEGVGSRRRFHADPVCFVIVFWGTKNSF